MSKVKIRRSIFEKLGYLVEYDDPDAGCEIEEGEEACEAEDAGYYWTDNDGNRSPEPFEGEDEAIADLLNHIDLKTEIEGVSLTKAEESFLGEEYGIKIG